jgi:hypothetical protein
MSREIVQFIAKLRSYVDRNTNRITANNRAYLEFNFEKLLLSYGEILSNVVYGRELSCILAERRIRKLNDANTVFELNTLNHLPESFESANLQPTLLGTLDEFED